MHQHRDGCHCLTIIIRGGKKRRTTWLDGLNLAIGTNRHHISDTSCRDAPSESLVSSILWNNGNQTVQIGCQIISDVALLLVMTTLIAERLHWDIALRHIYHKTLRHLLALSSLSWIGIVCQIVRIVDTDGDRRLADTNGTGLHT